MKRQIDNAIRTAKRRGQEPVEIRLGEPIYDTLVSEHPKAETGLYRTLPLVHVTTDDHASLKVAGGGEHIAIKREK